MERTDKQAVSEERRCSHCGSSHTSSGGWRRHPTTRRRLCNACGQYADTYGGHLPPASVLQRRLAEPRRLGTQEEIAQRRCLQCGSASPVSGKAACWCRHPATGEEWVCRPCRDRIYKRLRGDRRRQEACTTGGNTEAADIQQPAQLQRRLRAGHTHGTSNAEGGEQARAAPAPPPPPRKRRRQQEQHEPEGEAPAAFHNGPASAAKQRAGAKHAPPGDDGGRGCVPLVQQLTAQHGQPHIASTGGKMPQPAVMRRQRRKQTQPQHLPPLRQEEQEVSLAPTVRVGGTAEPSGSEVPAQASQPGALAAAGQAAAAAGAAAAGTLPDQQVPAPPQQPAAQLAVQAQPEQLPPQPEAAEPDLFDLLQQATEVAAAAASGLTPELVAAFAMLLPLNSTGQVGASGGVGCGAVLGHGHQWRVCF